MNHFIDTNTGEITHTEDDRLPHPGERRFDHIVATKTRESFGNDVTFEFVFGLDAACRCAKSECDWEGTETAEVRDLDGKVLQSFEGFFA